MKRILSVILSLFLLFAFFIPAYALYYKDDIYRLNDFSETLTDDEYKSLNAKIDNMVPKLKIDLPVYIFTAALNEGETVEDRADYFYDHNGFGYGDNKSGIILAVNFDSSVFGVYRYGDAQNLIDSDETNSITSSFSADYSNGVSVYNLIDNYLKNVESAVKAGSSAGNQDRADGMPYWYPEDTSGFTDFHGENLRRVVDDADIFTDEQEYILNERINEVIEKYNIGYALLTDDDNHGLSPEEYSSDFLHFGGYGVGDGYGAVVFYLCFDPSDRCWRTTSINSYESIFTAEVTYVIDELVDADIRAGRYYEAFLTHIDFVGELFENNGTVPEKYDNYIAGYSDYVSSSGKSSSFSTESLFICIVVAVIVGTIVGGLHLASCRSAMRVVAPVGAREYLVKDSFKLRDKKVYYLYSTVTRTAKPKSSSSGGGSSYSSGSSSGGSYSSGGRSF